MCNCKKCAEMSEQYVLLSEDSYPLQEGDKVCSSKEPALLGTIVHIDRNIPHPTTCEVHWDDYDDDDYSIHWTNRLMRVEK